MDEISRGWCSAWPAADMVLLHSEAVAPQHAIPAAMYVEAVASGDDAVNATGHGGLVWAGLEIAADMKLSVQRYFHHEMKCTQARLQLGLANVLESAGLQGLRQLQPHLFKS